MKKMLSGIKPSGELTLGNYIGAISQFVKLQDDYEMLIFVADLHAITVNQDKLELKKNIRDTLALYIACGLDPEKVTLFCQSDINEHAELGYLLQCNSYLGELNRMTQFKDKKLKQKDESLTCALYTYPTLMAADILIYDADYVPVGDDQKQHVELTRDIAERFNNKYGNTFKIPDVLITKIGKRIKDLQDPNKKMSKSDEDSKGCILLLEDINNVKKKIMSAQTDSDMKVLYDEINKPGISNLINIYSCLTNMEIKEVEIKFQNSNYGQFKNEVAETVINTLEIIQSKYNEIINNDLINSLFDKGYQKLKPLAEAKLKIVKEKIGLGR